MKAALFDPTFTPEPSLRDAVVIIKTSGHISLRGKICISRSASDGMKVGKDDSN